MSKAIEEANLIGRKLKVEANRVKVEAKVEAKRAKEEAKVAEEKKAALALAALKVPTSKGVYWQRNRSKWEVQFGSNGKKWYLGCFDFDDHTQAVAVYKRHESMTETELEALFIRH
jgi:hypothetical protein